MHVLHRPHLPRQLGASIVAALLAISISFALAGRLSTIGQSADVPAKATQREAPALLPTVTTPNSRATDTNAGKEVFAEVFGPSLPQVWPTPYR